MSRASDASARARADETRDPGATDNSGGPVALGPGIFARVRSLVRDTSDGGARCATKAGAWPRPAPPSTTVPPMTSSSGAGAAPWRGVPRLARRTAEGGVARRRLRHRRLHDPHRQDLQARARGGGRPRSGADRVRTPAAGGQARGLPRRRRTDAAVFRRHLRRGRVSAGDQLRSRPRPRRRPDAPRHKAVWHGRRLCMGFRRRPQPSWPFNRALSGLGIAPPQLPGTPNSTLEGLQVLFAGVGFDDIATRAIDGTCAFRDFDTFWRTQTPLMHPVGKLVAAMSEAGSRRPDGRRAGAGGSGAGRHDRLCRTCECGEGARAEVARATRLMEMRHSLVSRASASETPISGLPEIGS